MDIIVKELIEDLQENEECNSKDEGSDEQDTASNWEEAAASEILSSLIGALAEAAADHESSVLELLLDFVN